MKKGSIIQVSGPVVDVAFSAGELPGIREELTVAADQGYPPAQCELGLCYELGNGAEMDKLRAAELYREAGFQPNILFRSTDTESILMMVATEQGISILPDYATSKLDHADNLLFVPLEGKHEVEEITAVWRRDNQNPALHRYLRNMR